LVFFVSAFVSACFFCLPVSVIRKIKQRLHHFIHTSTPAGPLPLPLAPPPLPPASPGRTGRILYFWMSSINSFSFAAASALSLAMT
jgi:hypothetical protein